MLKQTRLSKNDEFVDHVTNYNIANTIQHIYDESHVLRTLTNNEQVGIVGAVYDVNSGDVHFKDFSQTLTTLSKQDETLLAEKLNKLIKTANI